MMTKAWKGVKEQTRKLQLEGANTKNGVMHGGEKFGCVDVSTLKLLRNT